MVLKIFNSSIFNCIVYLDDFIIIKSSKMMDLQAKLVVAFVWGIITFEATAYLYLYVPLLYEYNFAFFIFIVPIFITIVSILCVSYYKAIYTEPGYSNYHVVDLCNTKNMHYNDQLEEIKEKSRKENEMKKLWRANKKKGEINIHEIDSLNSIGYCFKCDLVKEARVHHCRICKKCILRMDHHCPWVGNCVGKLNHKYFILFLLYATTGLLIVAITFSADWYTGQFYAKQLNQLQYYTYYFSCITSYMLASSIGFLFVTQMITACQNITTLESFTEGITQKNPFTRASKVQNLREIFGSSNWFLPTDPFPTDCPLMNGSIDVL